MSKPTADSSPQELMCGVCGYATDKYQVMAMHMAEQHPERVDTSPGDELDELLITFRGVQVEPSSLESWNYHKDRLNRLMLTRERERLMELHRTDGKDLPKRDYDNVTDEAICERLDEIDAQLNKEEK